MRGVFLLVLIANMMYAQSLQERVQALIKPNEQTKIKRVKYDPFNNAKAVIKKVKKQSPQDKELYVDAVLNNKAFIKGAWRSVNDTFGKYHIIEITPQSVLVKKENKLIKLITRKTKRYIKTREEIDENK